MNNAPDTRLSLLARLADLQDQQAWCEFVDIYQPLIEGMARRQGLQEADAQDLVQVLLGRVAKKARNWQADRSTGTFRGWLAITTRNLAIDHFRRQQHQPTNLTDSNLVQIVDPIEQQYDWEQRRRLFQWAAHRCQNEFTGKSWEAFWMTAVMNKPIVEAASLLSISNGAVYIARSRIMARIRKLIESSSFDSCRMELT